MIRIREFLAWSAMLLMLPALPAVAAAQAASGSGASQAGATPAASEAVPYRINAGDELSIYVWAEERLQRDVRVLPDGTFTYPLVGKIEAQGRLPRELEAMIVERLRDQYRGEVPQVTVSVKAPSGLQFSVMGKVKAPGTFSPGRYVNVLEALSMAGGPSEFAKLDSVLLLRKSGTNIRSVSLRLGSIFRSGSGIGARDQGYIVGIESGDTIIVP